MDYHEDYLNSLPRFTIWMEPSPPRTCTQDPRGGSAPRDNEPFGVVEAARRLGCSPSYLRQLVHQDLIGHKWFGRMLKFRQQDIEDYWKSDHGRSRKSTGGDETLQRGSRTKKAKNTKGDKNTGVSRTDLKGRLSTWD